jgi:trimeric autotransporter adhesin
MASLFNTRISDTYQGLIKSIDNAALTATLKELTDGTGAATGVYMNTAGDFKVNAILEFGSLKDTGENIIITKFVDAADGIANNDNDTTIPTTAAIVDYVAAQITIEDLDFTGDTGSGQIDLDSQIFAIGGTVNEITTVASGQSLTLSLDSTGVYLPNNSTATTQTAGDNSTKLATTSYVDTLDAASDLDFSGDSGTGDINLNTEVLAVTGTANQIETTASGVGLSLSFPSAGITLPNGSVATTQTAGNNSTKVATTAYVDVLDAASDLDITGDTGTGDVNLNTQTLNILGTVNEITTAVVNQTATISLPSSISVDLVGNVTGNLTGNVTGNLTGNSAGTHTGAVVGNVTGNVIGNVTGALTGNADTSTAWQTARDLSVTGEATGIISNIDGTSNESGAITLDNNSVTGKVLTGLPTPSASSVLATDSIVEGIGKLQSQINGLAGGLRFMGSWDATANSPVLGSGGGEAAAGTTTSAAANKLIQTGQTFLSTVSVGDQVVNQVDGQSALVTNVDSNTILSLDGDIMLSGEAYTIDNSPFITQGNYYVVSVGGTTSLNGINQWTIGDWVIAGANNEWTKLDHSQVDGTGTVGNLTKWSSTSVIADSIVSESGSAITVDGSLSTNTNLSSTGNFAVNTDKFTANATTGAVAHLGNLAINTNKFTVNATSGNTAIAGDVNLPDSKKAIFGTGNDLQIYHDGSNSFIDETGAGGLILKTGEFYLRNPSNAEMIRASSGASVELYEAGSKKFETTSTGVSVIGGGTFAGNVTAEKSTFSSAATSAWITTIRNSAATGSSYGLTIEAGTNASDLALAVRSKAVVDLMVVRGDGNVGIGTGTDSPSSKLHIRTGTNNNYEFEEVSGELRFSALNDARSANVPLQFAASEFNFISGNVGIGTDTPLANLSVKASNTTGSIIEAAVLDGGGAAAEDGVSLGFTGFNTSTYPNWRYGSISGVYEEINSFKGALVFKTSTAQDGGTERMRITSGGNTQLSGNNLDIKGTSSGNTSVRINAITGTAGTNSLDLINDGTAAYIWNRASTPILFGIGGTERMRITSGGEVDIVGTVKSGGNQRFGAGPGHGNSSSPGITTKANGTAGVYWNADGSGGWGGGNFTTNNSDRNMKTNIVPMDIDALKIIDSLETKYFNWTEKANRGDTSIRKAGIIAQDLKELMPEGVYGAEWKDDDKESNGLSLDENATTALLIKAIQELKAEVDLLKQNCNCKN